MVRCRTSTWIRCLCQLSLSLTASFRQRQGRTNQQQLNHAHRCRRGVLVRKSSASRARTSHRREAPPDHSHAVLLASRDDDEDELSSSHLYLPDPCRPATMSRRKQSCPQHLAASKLDTSQPSPGQPDSQLRQVLADDDSEYLR